MIYDTQNRNVYVKLFGVKTRASSYFIFKKMEYEAEIVGSFLNVGGFLYTTKILQKVHEGIGHVGG